MIGAIHTLADHEGQLCIKLACREYDKPETSETYYPSQWDTRSWLNLFPDTLGSEVFEHGNGEYTFRANGFNRTIPLAQFGQTLPVKFERVPIEPPKCRLPLRYRNGRWEKETKRGYVPV